MSGIVSLVPFLLVSLGLALTPGPNMVHVVSRAIAQGRKAGLIALAGVSLGYVVYMLCAAFGLTALLFAVPFAYDTLRIGGALYLLYLAWSAVRPGGRSPFEARALPHDSPRRLFVMGLLTNLLNPKIAVIYLSLLPQFVDPARGHILGQSLMFGAIQTLMGIGVNGLVTITAGSIAGFLAGRPAWLVAQRWLMGTVLAGLAVRMATETRR